MLSNAKKRTETCSDVRALYADRKLSNVEFGLEHDAPQFGCQFARPAKANTVDRMREVDQATLEHSDKVARPTGQPIAFV